MAANGSATATSNSKDPTKYYTGKAGTSTAGTIKLAGTADVKILDVEGTQLHSSSAGTGPSGVVIAVTNAPATMVMKDANGKWDMKAKTDGGGKLTVTLNITYDATRQWSQDATGIWANGGSYPGKVIGGTQDT